MLLPDLNLQPTVVLDYLHWTSVLDRTIHLSFFCTVDLALSRFAALGRSGIFLIQVSVTRTPWLPSTKPSRMKLKAETNYHITECTCFFPPVHPITELSHLGCSSLLWSAFCCR
jgi:hypothetical protein